MRAHPAGARGLVFTNACACLCLLLAAACSAPDPGSLVGFRPRAGSSGGGSTSNRGASGADDAGNAAPSGGGSGSGDAPVGGDSGSGGASGDGDAGSASSGGGGDAGDAASGTGSGGGAVDAGSTLEDLCVNTINAYRATIGQPPYTRWTSNEACTSSEAQTDSQTQIAHSAFGRCGELGQCECPGWSGPLDQMIVGCLKAMWDEGPGGGHYDIMSSSNYTTVACGFYTMSDGSIWAAQNYE